MKEFLLCLGVSLILVGAMCAIANGQAYSIGGRFVSAVTALVFIAYAVHMARVVR